MNLKEKCRMLGLGCYGGKQTKEFIALGYKGNAANGSEQDLKALVPCKVQNCIKIILICFWDMILFLKRSDQYAKEKI